MNKCMCSISLFCATVCNSHKYHFSQFNLYPRQHKRVRESKSQDSEQGGCWHGALLTMGGGGERERERVVIGVVKRAHVTSGNSLPWICLLRSRGLLVSNPIHQNLCPYPYLCHSVLPLPASQGKWNSPHSLLHAPPSQTRPTHSPIPMSHIPLLSTYIHISCLKMWHQCRHPQLRHQF